MQQYTNTNPEKYISSDSGYIADKKYSMSYLKSENIDCNDFSHFKINYQGDTVIELYPADYRYSDDMDDLSVVRAKNVLISLKNLECIFYLQCRL
mgnify:CR=1 FL=1